MTRKIFRTTRYLFCLGVFALFFSVSPAKLAAQQVVDKIVATVSDNAVRPQIITYSDLLWQLALQPEAPISPPSSEDLNRALQTLINQRLVASAAVKNNLTITDESLLDTIHSIPAFKGPVAISWTTKSGSSANGV